MSKYGYFLYEITWSDRFEYSTVFPCKIYSSLSAAKNSKFVKESTYVNTAFVIVPMKCAYDRESLISCMCLNDSWSKILDEEISDIFYRWRAR